MDLKQLAVDHDYYASDSNYYSNDAALEYETWKEFYEEFQEADVDMNLVYRWDLREMEEGGYYMGIFMIKQRKGIYTPIMINLVEETDVPQIMEYLKPHFEKLMSLWTPLTTLFLNK